MSFLELFQCVNSRVGDTVAHILDVIGTFSELAGAKRDEILGRHAEILCRSEVGCFSDIEGE